MPRPKGHLSLLLFRIVSWAFTFAAVILTWVAFRATTWSGMWEIYQSMFMIGEHVVQADGFQFDPRVLSYPIPYHYLIPDSLTFWPWIVALIGLVICVAMPNTWQLVHQYEAKRGKYRLGANLATVIYFAFGSYFILYLQNRITEFIYFNF